MIRQQPMVVSVPAIAEHFSDGRPLLAGLQDPGDRGVLGLGDPELHVYGGNRQAARPAIAVTEVTDATRAIGSLTL
jgi:hypothetical protein